MLQCDVAVCCCSVMLQCVVAVCCCSVVLQCVVAVCCCSVFLQCVVAVCHLRGRATIGLVSFSFLFSFSNLPHPQITQPHIHKYVVSH